VVRERIRDYGVLKAIGLTPAQITSSLVGSDAALAAIASLVAIPLGIGLYLALMKAASGTTEDAVVAPCSSSPSQPASRPAWPHRSARPTRSATNDAAPLGS
jgi:ABC-type antimicrobial peptide transport system permease subunit